MHGIANDPRRGRFIPWLFLGGFLLVIAANAAMVTLALGTFTGLTTAEPYTKGLRYNEDLRAAEAQERLGWKLASRIVPRERGHVFIEISVADAAQRPLLDARVSATFSRPVEAGHDFSVALEPAGPGRFAARVEFPLRGAWDVNYRVESSGNALKARDRLQVE